MEKVSIIVPVYNVEKYLEKCVDSLVNQTYCNIEIILIDDGSTDSSGSLCDKYAEKYTNVFAYHKKNGGLSDARNVGLSKVTGEYVSFVDSDDWISTHMIEKMVNALHKFDAQIACCDYFVVEEDYIDRSVKLSGEIHCRETHDALKVLLLNTRVGSFVWNKLFSSRILINEKFPVGRCFEDAFVMHNWFKKAARVAFVEEQLYYYYQRETSISHSCNIEIIKDEIAAKRQRRKDMKDWGDDLNELAMSDMLFSLLISYLKLQDTSEMALQEQYWHEIRTYPLSCMKYLRIKSAIDFLILKYFRPLYKVWLPVRKKQLTKNRFFRAISKSYEKIRYHYVCRKLSVD